MTFLASISLLFAMLALAAIPSASVALVVSRSATLGFANGAAVAFGIVLGDLLFVALAVTGMSFLAESFGSFFVILRYAAAGYLLWMGVGLLRAKADYQITIKKGGRRSLVASFLAGLFLTLGDIKAILFYASLFPAFVDMQSLSAMDIAAIASVTVVAVGGVKLVYAAAARSLVNRLSTHQSNHLVRKAAGCSLIGAGSYLIVKG